MVLKELIFNSFYFGMSVVVLIELIFSNLSTLGGSGCLDRTEFSQFLLLEGVLVLKELIFHSLYFGRMWWS